MKANEFVKKFGWDRAKREVALIGTIAMMCGDNDFNNDLKRLVESHAMIEKDFESVEIAEYEYMVSGCYSEPYWIRIKQAIADVESCQ
ncbi:hypothetical protein [Acinetobacter sp. YH12211]|uniref:hypothetical protein n=1 Tax=Acinetobacter sp. YH12211 TaxID=2601147 RepID=UPI0015D32239|nr:hypothetical protein [Acinetobacter sp. YH12211]